MTWQGKYAFQEKYYNTHKEWAKKNRRRLRQEVIEAYGGKCVCCGEIEWKFLTIDHPNGNGQADRAKHRNTSYQLYGWLKRQGYPKENYQVLCMNCNWVRRYDVCPHQLTKEETQVKLKA